MARKTIRKATRARARTARRTSRKAQSARAKTVNKPVGLSIRTAAPGFTVNDIEKSIAWYRDVLGFVVGDRWENEGRLIGAEIAAGKVSFILGQDDWQKGRDRVKGEGVRIYGTTDQDVNRLAAAIKARGGALVHEPRDEWGMRSFAIADPDGFKITISSFLKG